MKDSASPISRPWVSASLSLLRQPACTEIIRNKEEGFLVSFGNINELALCIDKLAEDRSLLLDMSLAAISDIARITLGSIQRRRYMIFSVTW